MEITETRSEGLTREFKVVIPASDLDSRLTARLEDLKGKVQLKGFRRGKVPVSFLKKTYGKSLMGEIVEQAVSETSRQTLDERELRPALQPKLEVEGAIDDVIAGKADLTFTMAVELIPDFELTDLAALELERPVAEVTDEAVDDRLDQIARNNLTYSSRPEGEAAKEGDQLIIDFAGDVDGEPFPGGKGEDAPLVLGSGRFIPGFEDQLTGAKAGEEREVSVTFPEDYGAKNLAGKAAHFAVTVKDVAAPDPVVVDDEFAKRLGVEDLDQLKSAMADRLREEYAALSRAHLKRAMLDVLDKAHDFELPPGMVEGEFNGIWRHVEHQIEHHGRSPEDEGKSEDELKAEYRKIAERRVRLGLVLAEVGRRNNIVVSREELARAIGERARQFPGQERQVYDYYAKNEVAMAEIRAPLYEDKTIDFIAELAKVTDKPVDRETLLKEPEGEEEFDLDHDHDH